MPFWIEGWVEAARWHDLTCDYAWQGILKVGSIIDVSDPISELLFGLSKHCVADGITVDAVAAGRGLPSNPSAEAREELETIKQHEAKYGPGEFGGYTWASLQEIKTAVTGHPKLEGSAWHTLLQMLACLEQDSRFVCADRIRIIVWYNW